MVKHGLKDLGVGALSHGITVINHPFNRFDIGLILETKKITTLKLKDKIIRAKVYPMFNSEFGSLNYFDLAN